MDDFIRMLELEDSLPSTTSAQREANQHRRKMYLNINRERSVPSPTVNNNFGVELLMKRLEDPDYRMSVRTLLEE